MSVVVCDTAGKTQMVTKGAVEEMLDCCAWARAGRQGRAPDRGSAPPGAGQADGLNAQGMRVIAVAQKSNPAPVGQFSAADECDMVLIGFLAFLDPPKQTAPAAIEALHKLRRTGQGADRRQRKSDQGHLRPGGPARRAHPAGQRHRHHERRGAGRPGRESVGVCQAVPGPESPHRPAAAGERPLRGLHGGTASTMRPPCVAPT